MRAGVGIVYAADRVASPRGHPRRVDHQVRAHVSRRPIHRPEISAMSEILEPSRGLSPRKCLGYKRITLGWTRPDLARSPV